jgi:hypothetical protein
MLWAQLIILIVYRRISIILIYELHEGLLRLRIVKVSAVKGNQNDQVKESEMGRAWSTNGGDEEYI